MAHSHAQHAVRGTMIHRQFLINFGNGNITDHAITTDIEQRMVILQAVMLGRGLIADPGLLTGGTTADTLAEFHDCLLAEYIRAFGSERNAMFRMKENWRYWLCKFEDSGKLGKQIRKTTNVAEYKQIAHQIFHTLPMK